MTNVRKNLFELIMMFKVVVADQTGSFAIIPL